MPKRSRLQVSFDELEAMLAPRLLKTHARPSLVVGLAEGERSLPEGVRVIQVTLARTPMLTPTLTLTRAL